MSGCPFHFSRRGFLTAAGIAAAAGVGLGARGAVNALTGKASTGSTEPFLGIHQSGITTPAQSHTYFASFDLVTDKREDVIALLQKWTKASERMAKGLPADEIVPANADDAHDGGDALGLPPSRLTITFGFGPTLFNRDGKDRYGLASKRPAALVDMPVFSGDQLAVC